MNDFDVDREQSTRQSELSLSRLLPRIEPQLERLTEQDKSCFLERLTAEWPRLFRILLQLYGSKYDFFYYLECLLLDIARSWCGRPAQLKQLDMVRENNPDWFQSEQMLGGVCYVDLYTRDLAGIRNRIPYFRELGLTYLHLMPLFESPEGNSDGGYAVSSYRHVNPGLGTIEQLSELASDLRQAGISPVVDFVFNHTSDEHEWAQRAGAGEAEFEEYYYLFPDRTQPDEYERTLREIFPTVRRGSFTWREDIRRWVWTTFNSFQWDLNYSNMAVFRAMAGEMLFLANLGIEVLRLDAVAFIWKQMGTDCENRPEAHLIVQAMNAIARIAAPALQFKSEAIVHPEEVARYISREECRISYNPLLMALLWESLATRQVKLLLQSMRRHFSIPADCAWVNYLRSHDDIGWTFDDADARAIGIDPVGHRRFLNDFYTGRFAGSFARGLPFQENAETGDARVSGTLASLAGLEQAVHSGSEEEVRTAIARITLLNSVIVSVGGLPLIYLGDELGTMNDYHYSTDPGKADDSRWVHRPAADDELWKQRGSTETVAGRVYASLKQLLDLRKQLPELAGNRTEFFDTGNEHVFGFVRHAAGKRLLVLSSFSECEQQVDGNIVRAFGAAYNLVDLVGRRQVSCDGPLLLPEYGFVWLRPTET